MTKQPTTAAGPWERLRRAATLRLPDARLPRDEVDALIVEARQQDVERLVNAAHRMAKHTSLMKGEDGGAYVYHMKKANEAEGDVWRALRAFGVSMTERPPARLHEQGTGPREP